MMYITEVDNQEKNLLKEKKDEEIDNTKVKEESEGNKSEKANSEEDIFRDDNDEETYLTVEDEHTDEVLETNFNYQDSTTHFGGSTLKDSNTKNSDTNSPLKRKDTPLREYLQTRNGTAGTGSRNVKTSEKSKRPNMFGNDLHNSFDEVVSLDDEEIEERFKIDKIEVESKKTADFVPTFRNNPKTRSKPTINAQKIFFNYKNQSNNSSPKNRKIKEPQKKIEIRKEVKKEARLPPKRNIMRNKRNSKIAPKPLIMNGNNQAYKATSSNKRINSSIITEDKLGININSTSNSQDGSNIPIVDWNNDSKIYNEKTSKSKGSLNRIERRGNYPPSSLVSPKISKISKGSKHNLMFDDLEDFERNAIIEQFGFGESQKNFFRKRFKQR